MARLTNWALLALVSLASALGTSKNGQCGGDTGYTCAESKFGNCCSLAGQCGSTSDFCGTGCQSDFGICIKTILSTSIVPAVPSTVSSAVASTFTA